MSLIGKSIDRYHILEPLAQSARPAVGRSTDPATWLINNYPCNISLFTNNAGIHVKPAIYTLHRTVLDCVLEGLYLNWSNE